jgi:hypothetical protein
MLCEPRVQTSHFFTGRIGREDGVALLVAMMSLLLLTALGVVLVLTSSAETIMADHFRSSEETLYAADAVVERVMEDLLAVPDWNALLDGSSRSTFVDGAPSGPRVLPDGSTIDLAQVVNMANCRKATACSAADMDAVTAERPWGPNNPRWMPYAYGRLSDMLPAPNAIDSACYVLLLVGDDPSETDNDPTKDSDDLANPGSRVIAMRAEAFGPRGAHKVIELTAARSDATLGGENGYNGEIEEVAVRMLSWREVR